MSYSNEQWRIAIINLLKKTSSNAIQWEPSHLFEGDAWTVVDASLMTVFDGKAYVISQTRTKYYYDEDQYSWSGGFIFSIYEDVGFDSYRKIATAPQLSSLSALFEAAESNMAFNKNALDGLL
jgi:hypothetical protein